MILLNFSHPLTSEQLAQIEELTGQKVAEVRHVPIQFDHQRPFAPQVKELAEACELTSEEWQTRPILIVPPSLNFIACVLLAELHGRMGYFPPIVRLRPVEGSIPARYEVAEIINLQEVRDKARARR
ncbi:MAG: CRISPR-associated protein Csx15 [Anaerolineae bacterium]